MTPTTTEIAVIAQKTDLVPIPPALAYKVSGDAIRLYLYIAAWQEVGKEIDPETKRYIRRPFVRSAKAIAEDLGKTERTVFRWFAQLESAGYCYREPLGKAEGGRDISITHLFESPDACAEFAARFASGEIPPTNPDTLPEYLSGIVPNLAQNPSGAMTNLSGKLPTAMTNLSDNPPTAMKILSGNVLAEGKLTKMSCNIYIRALDTIVSNANAEQVGVDASETEHPTNNPDANPQALESADAHQKAQTPDETGESESADAPKKTRKRKAKAEACTHPWFAGIRSVIAERVFEGGSYARAGQLARYCVGEVVPSSDKDHPYQLGQPPASVAEVTRFLEEREDKLLYLRGITQWDIDFRLWLKEDRANRAAELRAARQQNQISPATLMYMRMRGAS